MMEIPITFQSDEKGYFDREYFNLKDFVLTSLSGLWFVTEMRLNLHIQNLKFYCCWLKMPE